MGIVKRKMRNKRPKKEDELKATVKETRASCPQFFLPPTKDTKPPKKTVEAYVMLEL